MKRMLPVAVLSLLLPGVAPAPEPVRLEIALTGLRSTDGEIRLCVWHGPARFPGGKCDGEGRQVVVAASAQATVSVPLAPGDYAVSLLHDENGNGKLDKNLFGIPKEGVGFSQNPVLAFGPPSYASTRFDVAANSAQTIKLKYFL